MLTSLRMRVVVAMLAMALGGVAGAYLIIDRVERAEESAASVRDATTLADRIAHLLATGTPPQTAAIAVGLLDDGLLVTDHGVVVARKPRTGAGPSATAVATWPAGRVEVIAPIENTRALSVELTGAAGVLMLFVAGGGVLVTEIVSRGVRRPLTGAVEAADRVATGDFQARIEHVGTSEFTRLAEAFNGMAARLADADRRERQFLADLAHEIATPLSIITGFAMSMADGTVTKRAELREAGQIISSETTRLSSLLEDLRRLTRLDWNQTVRHEQVDLAQFARDLTARFRPAARRAGVSLTVRTRPATLVTDPRLVDTVMANLLTNALRYTPAGGRVTIGLRHRAREVVLSVTDTGIGIPEEHREHVFDRFFRIDEARDRVSGGTGLGLAIARRATLTLGGRLEVDSTVGEGSEFRLVLPQHGGGDHPVTAAVGAEAGR